MTAEFKEGDVVRIARQPDHSYVYLQGKVGVVDEVSETKVLFVELKIDESCGGSGAVPKSCLEPVTDPKWILAKDDRDRKIAERIAAADVRTEKINAATEEAKRLVGIEFGMAGERIKEIVKSYNRTLGEQLEEAGIYRGY